MKKIIKFLISALILPGFSIGMWLDGEPVKDSWKRIKELWN